MYSVEYLSKDEIESENITLSDRLVYILLGLEAIVCIYIMPAPAYMSSQLGLSEDQL